MYGKKCINLFCSLKIVLAAFALFMMTEMLPTETIAKEMPAVVTSPLVGISFDNQPVVLSIQRNFQMAMLTASSQIGRSCSRMESYGWRMAQSEQYRVNQIFNTTVDRLRGLGYKVDAQTPKSISKDITLFTADRSNKHFLFMWSAGDIGLVLVLCESSAPLTGRMAEMYNNSSSESPALPQEVVQSGLDMPASNATKGPEVYDPARFNPAGNWIGNYTCMRGYTGAVMHIDKFRGEDFQGTLRFFPTPKNPYIAKGSYAIYGQYDSESKRILINPGKWLEHPNGYYKTIIIGSFDPVVHTFSGFFQGIMGCTSFEAKADNKNAELPAAKPAKKKRVKVKKTAVAPPVQIIQNPATPDDVIAPMTSSAPSAPAPVSSPGDAGSAADIKSTTPPINLPSTAPPAPDTVPASTGSTTSSPATDVPSSSVQGPSSTVVPAPSKISEPSSTPPAAAPPSETPALKPTGSLVPKAGLHAIMVADNAPMIPALSQAPDRTQQIPQQVQEYQVSPQAVEPVTESALPSSMQGDSYQSGGEDEAPFPMYDGPLPPSDESVPQNGQAVPPAPSGQMPVSQP